MRRDCWGRKPGKITGNGQKAERSQDRRSLRLCHRRQGKDRRDMLNTLMETCRIKIERSPDMAIIESLVAFISTDLVHCWK